MKKLLPVLCFAFFAELTHAQRRLSPSDSLLVITLAHQFKAREADYNCNTLKGRDKTRTQVVSTATLDSLFKPVFSKVVVNNKDLVANGSAYAFSFNKDQATFSLNYNDQGSGGRTYWNWGFQASTTEKFLKLFAKDEWQRGLGFSVGQTVPIKRGITYGPKDCQKLARSRVSMTPFWIASVRNLLAVDTTELQLKIQKTERGDYTIITLDKIHGYLDTLAFKNQAEYKAAKLRLDSVMKTRRNLNSAKGTDSLINDYIAGFEKEHFNEYGYNIWWFNWKLNPEYKGINIYDTGATKIFGIRRTDHFRVTAEGSVNVMINRRKSLLYLSAGLGVKNANYLEGKNATDVSILLGKITDGYELTKTVEATVTTDYDKYKEQFVLLCPSFGLNYFYGNKRRYGFDFLASTKLKFLGPGDTDFKNLFTIRTGFLFSLNGKSDLSNSTVGLIVTWEDLSYNKPTIKDNFTFGLRLGVPFNY